MIFTKINTKAFIISFAIGLLFVYLVTPYPKIIYKYPTPDNVDNVVYQDNGDNCYKFRAQEIKCPKEEKNISSYFKM